ncbi:MAG TPA: AtpZ/AtpI family protein [Candidatus Polarisedimenticolia bacterium]|nr:AtpZ/AtpI family protein [Candidatus Polarisedimenticolia bacterium]
MTEPPKRPPLIEAARYTQLGVMMVAPMLLLGGLGYWLDGRLGTGPWLLLGGLLLGMGAGFANFFMVVLGSGGGPGR